MYRETALGYAWALLPPLMTAVVFIYLKSNQIFSLGETEMPYPVFVVSGLVFWQTFADSINCPLKITSQSANLLGRVNFQREALILAGIGEVVFNLIVRLVLLVGVLVLFSLLPKATALLFPLGLFFLVAFGLMLGLFLLPAGLLYRDIGRGLSLILLLWMFLSPVLFPQPETSSMNLVTALNPMGVYITTLREMLFVGEFSQLAAFVAIRLSLLCCNL
jgi:lipopolysaccharide transport system permease protein